MGDTAEQDKGFPTNRGEEAALRVAGLCLTVTQLSCGPHTAGAILALRPGNPLGRRHAVHCSGNRSRSWGTSSRTARQLQLLVRKLASRYVEWVITS